MFKRDENTKWLGTPLSSTVLPTVSNQPQLWTDYVVAKGAGTPLEERKREYVPASEFTAYAEGAHHR